MPHGKRLHQKLHQAVFPASLPSFIPGNLITLLHNGGDYFPAIEAAIDRATHEIYLETYIYENDATGRRIADTLKRAALRGVNVYLISTDLPLSVASPLVSCQSGQLHGSSGIASRQDRSGG